MNLASLEKLIKPLKLELKQGCQDKAVVGGLAAYSKAWLVERGVGASAALQETVAQLVENYKSWDPNLRKIALLSLLEQLKQVGPIEEVGRAIEKKLAAESLKASSSALNPLAPLEILPGLGGKRISAFKDLGVESIEDLLRHYPREWQDRSRVLPIANAIPGQIQTLIGTVRGASTFRTRSRMAITEVAVQDETGVVFATYFNQPFQQKRFTAGLKVVLSGKIERKGSKLTMANPEAELMADGEDELIHTGRVVPIYPLTRELSQRICRSAMWRALPSADELADSTPLEIRHSLKLKDLGQALRQIHFPDSEEERLEARKRLVFDEFFLVGLGMALRKARAQSELAEPLKPGPALDRFLKNLPFSMTRAQARSWTHIQSDLARDRPMQRLLQGDVGSGKTLVAAAALLTAWENGWQSALMAPTEILADQHLATLRRWFEPLGVEVLPLSQGQSAKGRREVISHLASGQPLIAVGTQALIQKGVEFGRLGLVVVDEQHRFGVLQRLGLAKKAKIKPHTLVMTATPIPRTLTMTAYGDLDVSMIDELPPGRTPVATKWFGSAQRQLAYDAVRAEVKAGRQAYVVYALVDESDKIQSRAATQMFEQLRKDIFREFRVELLHGRMKNDEKDAVMDRFKNAKADILCSTTVIEVGVDVPNASVMIVEDAERFGLAQLHQLRGRVGRGSAVSYCYLLSDPNTEDGVKRLEVMCATNDGFKIAEADLDLRGPGEVLGIRQSGLPDFKLAHLIKDADILIEAKKEAEALIAKDPSLKEHADLRALVKRRIEKKLELGDVG